MTRAAWGGAALAAVLLALAVIGPWIAPDPLLMDNLATGTLLPPSSANLLGTDQYSRDVFSRLAHGAAVSLTVAGVAVIVALVIGATVGVIAGAGNGALGVVAPDHRSRPRVAAHCGADGAPRSAGHAAAHHLCDGHRRHRLAGDCPARARRDAPTATGGVRRRGPGTRSTAAARAVAGDPSRRTGPALVAATLGVADAILLEAGLSFLGLGMAADAPSWGGMIIESRGYLHVAPRLLLVPVAALVAATSSATLLGEALRRSLQPDTP